MAPRVELIPEVKDLSPESQAVLDAYLKKTGGEYLKIALDVDHPWREKNTPEHEEWVTQFVKVLGHSPGLLKAWLEKDWYMVRESLIAKKDVQLTEMVGLVVAIALECPYCIAWHSAASRFEGAEPDLVTKLRNYDEHRDAFSEMQQATFDYARKIANHAYQVTDEEVAGLGKWFSLPEIVELTELACHMSALSKFFSALNVEIW
ncbi:carboxymuconolactone decarboxylase family protein [Amycolatopsis jejuensis]|uniref:carboxymuconolactone decarboxylase family protein n=1 Tax=Amycolatopsis jejuensis TaxID=330084 RepID=UPI000525A859|nr:carboxymuconolactone decarboxylase family protein [Amycolatopsis jejuensis]